MSFNRWRVNIKNLVTHIRVGIHPHEREPQRVMINATIEAEYALKPQSIDECFNYDHVHRLVVSEWPKHAHEELLETYVAELLEYIFRKNDRVTWAKASVCKPDIFSEAEAVGVESEWTRADFERLVLKKS